MAAEAGGLQAAEVVDASTALAISGSTVLSLRGHLFDSGLINAALDVVERAGGFFDVLGLDVRPNPIDALAPSDDPLAQRVMSTATLQLTPASEVVEGALMVHSAMARRICRLVLVAVCALMVIALPRCEL